MNGPRRVALVAGATRGAGRAIAVELARAGVYVYATGRSSRASGPSEMGRPRTARADGTLGLVVEMTDGTSEANAEFRRNVGFYYDLVKANVERIVKGLAVELQNEPAVVVGVTPGWLRSERMLEQFGVSEANWRDACRDRPGFAISESPTYVARGVAALARAGDAERWQGSIASSRQLADAYGVTDTDGSRPDCWGHLAAYGWGHDDGRGIDEFR